MLSPVLIGYPVDEQLPTVDFFDLINASRTSCFDFKYPKVEFVMSDPHSLY